MNGIRRPDNETAALAGVFRKNPWQDPWPKLSGVFVHCLFSVRNMFFWEFGWWSLSPSVQNDWPHLI
jgi:hypothetical protein